MAHRSGLNMFCSVLSPVFKTPILFPSFCLALNQLRTDIVADLWKKNGPQKKTQLACDSGSGVRHLTFSGVPTSHLLGGSPSRQLEPPDRVSSNSLITSARGFAITSARGFGGSTSHLHAADDTHPLTFTQTNPPSCQQGGTNLTFTR